MKGGHNPWQKCTESPAFQHPPDGRHALRAQARARAQCSAGTQREPRGRGPAVRHSQHHLQHGSVPDLVLRRLDPSPHFKAHPGNHGVLAAFPPSLAPLNHTTSRHPVSHNTYTSNNNEPKCFGPCFAACASLNSDDLWALRVDEVVTVMKESATL